MNSPLLQVEGLWKTFSRDDGPVLQDVHFEVEEGELFGLVGPSGCGKTTALRIIAGFEHPDAGAIALRGNAIAGDRVHMPPEARGIGFVFQDYALFPHLTVLENVMFGLHRQPKSDALPRAEEVLDMVGLGSLHNRLPSQLSGGQQQRVALARSLAPAPRLILLDEPFSNLDAALLLTTRHEVRNLLKQTGTSAVLVTHDQEEAMTMADRIAVMQDGAIEQTGVPEEVYRRPRTPFVAQFLGATNLISAAADGKHAQSLLGRLCLDRKAQGTVLVSLRPEQVALETPTVQEIVGEVLAREFKGHDQTYRVRVGDMELVIQTPPTSPWRVGDQVALRPVEPAVIVATSQGHAPVEASRNGLFSDKQKARN